jgi:4-hydroxybenzoate polyprenyltransferase
LKAAYRKELGNLSLLSDSTPIGKRNFLLCYQKAREQSLIAQNIKAGWKATGLWPLNIAKPLMSRLLLENSNNGGQLALNDSIREKGLAWSENISAVSGRP